MQSVLHKLVTSDLKVDPVRESREAIGQMVPTFLSPAEEMAGFVAELRRALEALRETEHVEFTNTTWQAMLPGLRRLREEATALERALTPPTPSVRNRKKKTQTH